jgi:hypothetical protein
VTYRGRRSYSVGLAACAQSRRADAVGVHAAQGMEPVKALHDIGVEEKTPKRTTIGQNRLVHHDRAFFKLHPQAPSLGGTVVDTSEAWLMNALILPNLIPSKNAKEDCRRGTGRLVQGNPAGALADFDRVLEAAPDYPEAFNNRGVARHGLGTGTGTRLGSR